MVQPGGKGKHGQQMSVRALDPGKAEQALDRRLPSLPSSSRHSVPQPIKAGIYLVMNVMSATCIVFANKSLFTFFNFRFVYALTLVHVITTLVGMHIFAALGLYERKKLPIRPLISLAAAFTGYIVCWNISLQVNTVGFYQLSKICITPAVLAFDAFTSNKYPTGKEIGAVVLLCVGVTLATVTDKQVATNLVGLGVGVAAVCFTAVYQVFAGSKQKQLEVGSMALMAGYTPIATVMLAVLVPIFEPLGLSTWAPDTLLGFPYTPKAVAAISVTAILGLLVSLSTFLVIGATSSVTYNVVGHMKTVIVLTGGCLLFGEEMPMKRLLGVCLALSGIFWYSALKLRAASQQVKERPIMPERESLLRNRSSNSIDKLGEKQAERSEQE